MRSRLLAILGASAFVVFAVGLDACSSSDAPSNDAADASEAGRRGSVTPVADAEPACDPAADLLANVKDAAIGDGSTTTGACVACMRVECADQVEACTTDCACQGIMGRAIDCYLSTQQLGCLGELTNYLVPPETRMTALQLTGCARSSCAAACAVDAGPPSEAGPGPTDSGSDSSTGADMDAGDADGS